MNEFLPDFYVIEIKLKEPQLIVKSLYDRFKLIELGDNINDS